MKSFTHGSLTFPVIDKGLKTHKTVILLHGFPATAESWLPVANKLVVAGYHVLIPELRGYTSTAQPKQRREYRMTELVADVKALIDAAEVKKVHLVGHDWGGAVAWAFASAYPQLLASLTAVSTPHPQAFKRALYTSRQLFMSWYMLFFQLPIIPEWTMQLKSGATLQKALIKSGLNPTSAKSYAKHMQQNGMATTMINWYRAIFDGNRTDFITTPTLFIYGEKDAFLSHKAASLTKQWVKAPYIEYYLPNEGHWIIEESPDMLAAKIIDWLYQTSPNHHQSFVQR